MTTHPSGRGLEGHPRHPRRPRRHPAPSPARPVADRVVAKTGSIRGVSTLAGYATGLSGKIYAFAILLNGPGVWDGGGHAYQDRLLRALIKNG